MKILIVKDYDELSQKAAEKVIEVANSTEKQVNICIPTGLTPGGMYKQLVQYSDRQSSIFQNVNWFTLDEYIDIPNGSALSCFKKLQDQFYRPAGISPERIFTFNTEAMDFNKEALRYENLISSLGGLDLCILGIGRNGHVGFNEPGSERESRARVMTLQAITIEQSKNYFSKGEIPPTKGITLGMKMLMESKEVFLFANGTEKSDVVQAVVEGDIKSTIPSSFFRTIPQAQLIIDGLAASKLKIRR